MKRNIYQSIAMAVQNFMDTAAPKQQLTRAGKWCGLMPRNHYNDQTCRSKYTPHQGVGEIARRKRQIEKGVLKI